MIRQLALASALLLAGCSQFNMAPACSDTPDGVRGTLLGGLPDGSTLDHARLAAIVAVSEPVEVASAYNERTCTATAGLTDGPPVSVTYRVRQSEGLQNWYGVEFLNPSDPDLNALAGEVRLLYHRG